MVKTNYMYTTMKSPIPEFLNSELETFDASKVFTNGQYYLFEKRLAYLQVRLDLYRINSDKYLTWIVWVYLDADDFIKFSQDSNKYRGLVYAKLHADLLHFPNTKNLEVLIDFTRRDENFIPSVIILKQNSNKLLFESFVEGIKEESFDKMISQINN